MIESLVKLHDNLTVELKLGYHARKKRKISEFSVNTWFFIPNSLDVNPATYGKGEFYRDLKANIRLSTPVFLLRDIAGEGHSPLHRLQEAFEQLASHPSRTAAEVYEYQIRMFLSILKSALRDEVANIDKNEFSEDKEFLVDGFVSNAASIAAKYRELRRIINVPTIQKSHRNYFLFGDEFMSNLIEYHAFLLVSKLDKLEPPGAESYRRQILDLVHHEIDYKRRIGFRVVSRDQKEDNRELTVRMGLLKKYAESELFVKTNKKRDRIWVEQVYLSLAAGISMVFATAMAFSFQSRFGNLTMPFFVALVISYMLKDRIKELTRYYFAHKLGKWSFDHKTIVGLGRKAIGQVREAMDYISETKVPPEVIKRRDRSPILEANNRINGEQIILYRKHVRLNRQLLDESSLYQINGLVEILRLNLSNLTQKMDNPEVPLFAPDDNALGYSVIKAEKLYFLNMILQFRYEDQTELKRYRIGFNRNGLKTIENFDP
ncbi:MAG: hypothetical protein V2I46_09430 [Bacteroides sp.]|jgi:hypothetical protein|nr:hypothetical protein [Bacteroides sp.]